ncbi:pyridoxal phosphate-dependent aminotransferase [Halomonas piscis]|uniref:pyridoxal phosphate-dependent aminotransferase n=1 Tax=Halomonas piscis TaxID=3031727 RepID=UPI00289B7034|nr:histidinol-phosphate transaminase [Halomonas piscis]
MPRYPHHLDGDGPHNPFPGVKVLERKLGHAIPHRLGSNEGLDMPHRALRERFGDAAVEHAYGYGDAEALGVRRRLAAQQGIELDTLLVDAGADSLIALSLRALVEPGNAVVATAGTYPTFGYFARGHGAEVVEVPYRQAPGVLAPDLEALAGAARRHRARLVYLANPDNPGGHLHSDADVAALRAELPDGCWLLLDEAYGDFRHDANSDSLARALPDAIRLRTLSKAHGLAGLRIGYAIAEPWVVALMMKVRIHYAVSTLTQAMAETVLDHPGETRAHIEAVKERRERLAAHLRGLGGEVLPSATNFVALRLESAEAAAWVHQTLLGEGKLIARPGHPDIASLLRITAVEDALAPGRLAPLEAALRAGAAPS